MCEPSPVEEGTATSRTHADITPRQSQVDWLKTELRHKDEILEMFKGQRTLEKENSKLKEELKAIEEKLLQEQRKNKQLEEDKQELETIIEKLKQRNDQLDKTIHKPKKSRHSRSKFRFLKQWYSVFWNAVLPSRLLPYFLKYKDIKAGVVLMQEAQENESEVEDGTSIGPLDLENLAPLDPYVMNNKSRGTFLIFNHKYFENNPGDIVDHTRYGTNKDAESLEKAAKDLGFLQAERFDDFTKAKVKAKLKEVSQRNFEDQDCLVCCYLTHGNLNNLVTKKWSEHIDVRLLWESFTSDKCPSLDGKPKIFIIQACRGKEKEKWVGKSGADEPSDPPVIEHGEFHGLLLPEDVIVAYSTLPGYVSWRSRTYGTYLIQALCDVISKASYLEINQMLLRANRELIEKMRGGNAAQVSCFQSTLTKELKFKSDQNHC